MRALVIYESMYGDTRAVATAGLIVAGAPTHRHGMPTLASRRLAVEAARKAGSGLTMDPDADGPGLRAWLEALDAAVGSAGRRDRPRGLRH